MANEKLNEPENTVWCVIDSGTRRLTGRARLPDDASLRAMSSIVVELFEALELRCDLIRVPTPQGMAEMYHVASVPVDAETGPVTVRYVSVSNLRTFDEMSDNGAAILQSRNQLLDNLAQARAQRAGIQLAPSMPQGQMPRGGLIVTR